METRSFAEGYEQRAFAEFRVHEEDGQAPTLEGIAAPFGKLSEDLGGFRERIKPGSFRASIKGERRDVAAMREHNPELLLGRQSAGTLVMREKKEGLSVIITPPDTELGRSTVEAVRRGDLRSMSFGFVALDSKWERVGGEDVRVLGDVDLFDVSVVTFPAYPDTRVAQRSLLAWRDSLNEEEESKAALELEYEHRNRIIDMGAR